MIANMISGAIPGSQGVNFNGVAEFNTASDQNALAINSRGWFDYTQKLALPGTFSATMLCAAFSPDGQYLAIGGGTTTSLGILRVIRMSDGQELLLPVGSQNPAGHVVITCVCFSPTNHLFVGYGSGTSGVIWQYSISGGSLVYVRSLAYRYTSTVPYANKMAFSPDGRYLAVALSAAPAIGIWEWTGTDINTAQLPNPAILPSGSANTLDFSPDGKYLVVGHASGDTITIYDVDAGFVKIPTESYLRPGLGSIYAVKFSPDGSKLYVGGSNAPRFCFHNFQNGYIDGLTQLGESISGRVTGIAISKDGQQVLALHNTSPFATGFRQPFPNSHIFPFSSVGNITGNANGAAVSPDGKIIVVPHATAPYCSMYKTYMENTITTGTFNDFGNHLLSSNYVGDNPGVTGIGKVSNNYSAGSMASMNILVLK